MKASALLLACYFMGAIPIGLIVGKLVKGIDIRQHGSGNIGASNVLRLLGPGPAAGVFIGDLLKGLIAVVICRAAFGNAYLLIVVGGMAAILGHNFSVFLGFRGGKGVATSLGVLVGINAFIAAMAFGVWLILLGMFRYISVASIAAAATVPLQMWLSGPLFGRPIPNEYVGFGVAAAVAILAKHRSNIARLRAGTEPKIGQRPTGAG